MRIAAQWRSSRESELMHGVWSDAAPSAIDGSNTSGGFHSRDHASMDSAALSISTTWWSTERSGAAAAHTLNL